MHDPTTANPPADADAGIDAEDFSPLALAATLGAPLPDYKAAGTTETDFGGLLAGKPPLRLHEDVRDGCGGRLWPAGMVLARYMLRYHADGALRGKRV